MNRSDSIAELAGALSKAQGAVVAVGYDKEVKTTQYSYKYATLATIQSAIRPALAANDLALTMAPTIDGNRAGVDWVLMHKSGEWMDGQVLFPIGQTTPQAAGSAISYAKRYTSAALLGITADDDDDAQSAMPTTAQQGRQTPTSATEARTAPKRAQEPAPHAKPRTEAKDEPTPASYEQKKALFAAMTKRGLYTEDRDARRILCDQVLGIGACESFKCLTSAQAHALLDAVGDGPDAWADMRLRQIWSRAANERASAGPPSLLDDTQPGVPDPFGEEGQ